MASLLPDVFALLEGEFGGAKEAEEVKKNQKVCVAPAVDCLGPFYL